MPELIESYQLGDIKIRIETKENPDKLEVFCNDGNYRSHFTVRKYEYENYKRHMNQRIKDAYNEQYETEDGEGDGDSD